MAHEEVFLPFPAARRDLVAPATHMKGTWLLSSTRALRVRGRLDAYLENLPPEHRDVVQHGVVGDWHPMETMLAHYGALDRLELPAAEIVAMGRDVTSQAQGNVFVMAARAAASALDAWTILGQFQTIWSRFVRGGGIGVFKLGPKEARLEVVQFPPSRSRYCQVATKGVINNALALFCTKVYVTEVPGLTTDSQIVVRIAWV